MARLPFNLTDGRPAYGCPHMAQWSASFQRLLIRAGKIKSSLDCVQAQGGSPLSGGTHVEGTALDLVGSQCDPEVIRLAREGGARATWGRGSWVARLGAVLRARRFARHIHLAIDCPCISGADYQLDEADNGYDGLVGNGRDYHPAPKVRRNWQQGIEWMDRQYPEPPKPTRKVIIPMDEKELFRALDRYAAQVISGARGMTVLHNWAAIPWHAAFGRKRGTTGTKSSDWTRPMEAIKQAVKR